MASLASARTRLRAARRGPTSGHYVGTTRRDRLGLDVAMVPTSRKDAQVVRTAVSAPVGTKRPVHVPTRPTAPAPSSAGDACLASGARSARAYRPAGAPGGAPSAVVAGPPSVAVATSTPAAARAAQVQGDGEPAIHPDADAADDGGAAPGAPHPSSARSGGAAAASATPLLMTTAPAAAFAAGDAIKSKQKELLQRMQEEKRKKDDDAAQLERRLARRAKLKRERIIAQAEERRRAAADSNAAPGGAVAAGEADDVAAPAALSSPSEVDEHHAAVALQRVNRGHRARAAVKEHRAAISLQRVNRGHQARTRARKRAVPVGGEPEEQAVDDIREEEAADDEPEEQAVDDEPEEQAVDDIPEEEAADDEPEEEAPGRGSEPWRPTGSFWTRFVDSVPAEAAADDQEDADALRDELLEAGRTIDAQAARIAELEAALSAKGSRPRPAASAATPEKYIEIFHELDEDDGGTLDVEEVFKGLKKAGHKVTQKQAAQWIRDAAEDETATELNLEQFVALMTKRGKSGADDRPAAAKGKHQQNGAQAYTRAGAGWGIPERPRRRKGRRFDGIHGADRATFYRRQDPRNVRNLKIKVEALEKIHPAVFEGSKSKVAARRAKPAPETTTDAPPSTARLAAAGSASTAARNFGST